jgi:hypothetical protein
MAKQTTDRLVHHYDTEHRRILCGASSPDDHSTKHSRGVTCSDCIALLRERDAVGADGTTTVSSESGV